MKHATHREDGSIWAVKIIDKNNLSAEDAEALDMEVAVLEQVLFIRMFGFDSLDFGLFLFSSESGQA